MYWIWVTYILRLLLPLGFLCAQLWCDEPSWQGRARVKALRGLDQFLNWSIPSERSYHLSDSAEEVTYDNDVPAIVEFSSQYGYFSAYRPLVATATSDLHDIELVHDLLECVNRKIANLEQKQLMTAEIMTKVLAYRDLKIGDTFNLCLGDTPKKYVVDIVFNLWHGMPAFGLIPQDNVAAAPILLFRGTDPSLDSQRGWASLISDLDIAGPGYKAFQKAKKELQSWLKKVTTSGRKAKVMGFSLGGALAAYTYLFENDLMSDEPSYAFNAPGLSIKLLEQWNELPSSVAFRSYVTLGDMVSKVGRLFGTVYELRIDKDLLPLEAHTQLMLAQPITTQATVDVIEENRSR